MSFVLPLRIKVKADTTNAYRRKTNYVYIQTENVKKKKKKKRSQKRPT